jgi:hypothetical protein
MLPPLDDIRLQLLMFNFGILRFLMLRSPGFFLAYFVASTSRMLPLASPRVLPCSNPSKRKRRGSAAFIGR